MSYKYICQFRRGWKWDADPETGRPRDDWAEYEKKPDDERRDPLAGEIVIEYDNGVPRLKIGDGINKFSDLPYISVDSFILPSQSTITIVPDKWMRLDYDNKIIDSNGNVIGADGNISEEGYYEVDEDGNIIDADKKLVEKRYVQFVKVANATVTPSSKVDIQISPSDLVIFGEKDATFTAINAGGCVRICVVGQKPANSYTFNVTVTEVV